MLAGGQTRERAYEANTLPAQDFFDPREFFFVTVRAWFAACVYGVAFAVICDGAVIQSRYVLALLRRACAHCSH